MVSAEMISEIYIQATEVRSQLHPIISFPCFLPMSVAQLLGVTVSIDEVRKAKSQK
jgi:hypothetical protein